MTAFYVINSAYGGSKPPPYAREEKWSRYAAKRSSIYAFAFDILPLGNSIYPSGERRRERKRGTIGGKEKRRQEKT